MEATILINRAFGETRVALLEDGAAARVVAAPDRAHAAEPDLVIL